MSEPIPHSDGAVINHQDKRLLDPGEREKRESYLKDTIGLSQEKIDKLKEIKPQLYSTESIIEKVDGLKDRGFANPNKMIESLPSILGLAFENIDAKISGLKDRGFTNPNKIIETLPAILSYAFENIDAKINLLSRLNNLYQLNLNPITTIESNLPILGTKFEKLIVIARILRDYQPSPEDIQRKINHLYKINLESLLISYSQRKSSDIVDNLTRTADQIQEQKLSKDYKRQLIKDFFNKNPDSYKIYRDYLKGYPEKVIN